VSLVALSQCAALDTAICRGVLEGNALQMRIQVPVVHPVFRGGEVLNAHRNLDQRTSLETANLLASRASRLVDDLKVILEKKTGRAICAIRALMPRLSAARAQSSIIRNSHSGSKIALGMAALA